jgi:hypothetical protein
MKTNSQHPVSLNTLRPAIMLPVFFLAFLSVAAHSSAAAGKEARSEHDLEAIARDQADELGIPEEIVVAIVSHNPRLISVEYVTGRTDRFRMAFDAGFLGTLDDCELRAAVAHEVGHIWLFTHFPFLHTEESANHQALKLVSAVDLERVYEKVRRHNGDGSAGRGKD